MRLINGDWMRLLKKWKKPLMISLIVIGVSSTSACLFESSDKDWFTPNIYARFDSINLSSLSNTLKKHNISYIFNPDEGGPNHQQEGLIVFLTDNTTYVFLNASYNTSATFVDFHNDVDNRHIWMNMRLDATSYPKYWYPSVEEAKNSTYLLEPSWDLIKYFLNESSNPMPYYVEYDVY